MAQRRMFSRDVVCSDRFLDLPPLAQCLYLQLGMIADDDGFVDSPKRVVRIVGAKDSDLQTLCESEFIIPFHSGVIVLRHWKVNNYVKSDRYRKTQYQDEFSQLISEPNKPYQMVKNEPEPKWNHHGSRTAPQDRIGKDRLGKVNNTLVHPSGTNEGDQTKSNQQKKLPPHFETFWKAYPRRQSREKAIRAWKKLKVDEELLNVILEAIERTKKTDQWQRENGRYIPLPASWLNQRRWEDEDLQAPEQAIPDCWVEN